MPYYESGPKKGERMATNERTKALRGYKPDSKKSPTGTATIGNGSSSSAGASSS